MNTPLPFAEQLAANKVQELTYLVTDVKNYQATLNYFAGVGELFMVQAEELDKVHQTIAIVTGNSNNRSSTLLLGESLNSDFITSIVATRLELDLD